MSRGRGGLCSWPCPTVCLLWHPERLVKRFNTSDKPLNCVQTEQADTSGQTAAALFVKQWVGRCMIYSFNATAGCPDCFVGRLKEISLSILYSNYDAVCVNSTPTTSVCGGDRGVNFVILATVYLYSGYPKMNSNYNSDATPKKKCNPKRFSQCCPHLTCPTGWARRVGLPAPGRLCSSQTQWGHTSRKRSRR